MGGILAGIGSFFGIPDELVILSSKASTKLYGQNSVRPSKNATVKAVLGKAKDPDQSHSYFDHYWYQLNGTKINMTTFYRYGLNRFPETIPTSEITGVSVDEVAVGNALISEFGANTLLKEVSSKYPTPLEHFQEHLQVAPYNYKPAKDTLTYTDSTTSTSYDDWAIEKADFVTATSTYDITLTRQASVAEFWLTGDSVVVEGQSAHYRLHSTIKVPSGSPITINLTYGGTAPNTDYQEVISIDMLEGNDYVDFVVPINENIIVEGSRTLTITIGLIDNSGSVFQSVASIVPNTVTTLIRDNDTPTLHIRDTSVDETLGSINIPVKLLKDSLGTFTVDYTTVAGTATAGADYVTTSGTLTFLGYENELQGITVPIITDLVGDSGETFTVTLSNCSDSLIDISTIGTVTITDSSAGDPSTATVTTTEILNLPNFPRIQSLVIKYYNVATDPLILDWHYWIYDLSTNEYSGMTPTVSTTTNFELCPIGVIRKEATSIEVYGSSEHQLQMNLLFKKLNLNLSEVIDNIESSPDVDVMREVYLNIGVSPLDSGFEVSKLLWGLLYPIIQETPVTSTQGDFKLTLVKDKIKNVLSWTYQNYTPGIVGTIGTIGHVTHQVFGLNLIVKNQTTATTYDQLEIRDITGNYKVEYEGEYYVATNDLESTDLTFPVSWYSLNQLSPKEQMDVYDKIVRLDFYAVEEVEIAWYKTAGFMKLFQVILIIITIYSGGLFAPATAGAATGATVGTSSILALAQQIAINYAISAVVSKIAEATGNPFLAAAVGILASMSFAPGNSFESFGSMFDAKSLLELSINFAEQFSKSYKVILDSEAKQLSEDIEEFNELAKERIDLLEDSLDPPALDAGFTAFLRSVDAGNQVALSGLYEYDALFDYDRIVGKYNENLLRLGVV